jgi:hypothetical protein
VVKAAFKVRLCPKVLEDIPETIEKDLRPSINPLLSEGNTKLKSKRSQIVQIGEVQLQHLAGGQHDNVVAASGYTLRRDDLRSIGSGVVPGNREVAAKVGRIDGFLERATSRAADFVVKSRNVDDVGCGALRETESEDQDCGESSPSATAELGQDELIQHEWQNPSLREK